MFNVLLGLHEGAHGTLTVSREPNTGQGPFVLGQLVKTVGGKLTVAAAAGDASEAEFVFESLAGQSSQKYTCVFGFLEAETDVYNGTPNIDELLTCGADGKLTVTATAAEAKWKVVSKSGNVIRFKKLN